VISFLGTQDLLKVLKLTRKEAQVAKASTVPVIGVFIDNTVNFAIVK
jgi:hypothetical protein